MSAQNVEQLTDLTDYLLEGLEGPDPEILRAKDDLVFYSEYLFLDEDENPLKNEEFHLELYEALQSDAIYILILLPRGFAKSTICSIIFPSWMLGNNPNLRFVIGSESWSQASQFLRAVEAVMKDERYQAIFGNLIPAPKTSTWNDSEKYCIRSNPFIKEPSLLALGMEGSIPSRRCDYFIGDDLISRRNSGTPEARKKVSQNFWTAFSPMARWGTRFIIDGTPHFPDDLYDELIERWDPLVDEGVAKIIRIPALRRKGKQWASIWPKRYPTEMLLRLRNFDRSSFSSQYMLKPLGEGTEGIDFDKKHVTWFTSLPKQDDKIDVYAALDPGGWGKRRRTNNFSVCVAYRNSGNRDLHLVYSRIGKGGLEAHATALIAMDALWKPRKIFVESNAAQMLLFEYLKKETKLPLEPVDSKSAKEARLAILGRHCKSGKVKLRGQTYRGKTGAHKEIKPFWDEFTSYPGRDDALDAAALLVENLLERGPPPALSVQESTFEAPRRAQLMQREARIFGRQRLGLFRTSRLDNEAAWYAKMQQLKTQLEALKQEGVLTDGEIFDKLNKEFRFEPREANICEVLLRRQNA